MAHPWEMNFDLNERRFWRPFFSSRFPRSQSSLPSVQEHHLVYSESDPSKAKTIQINVTESIKIAMRQWRRHNTFFNLEMSNCLGSILEEIEGTTFNGLPISEDDHQSMIDQLLRGRTAFGFALQHTTLDIDAITDELKATNIHSNRQPGIEIGLAVRVFPYVGEIYSVRSFICFLTQACH
jgi:hypothetical protein